MSRRVAPALAPYAVRLREIERELAHLRQEQRLFRRLGFGENVKAMQIVALQVEQRDCLAVLRPNAPSWALDPRVVVAKKIVATAALFAGLLAGGLFAGAKKSARLMPRTPASRVPARRALRGEPVAPGFGRAITNW